MLLSNDETDCWYNLISVFLNHQDNQIKKMSHKKNHLIKNREVETIFTIN